MADFLSSILSPLKINPVFNHEIDFPDLIKQGKQYLDAKLHE